MKKLGEVSKTAGKLAGVGAITMLAGAYVGHKVTMNAAKDVITEYKIDAINSERESQRSSEAAKKSADASERAMIAAITTRFFSSAQMCVNLGQATPILMRHVQTIKPNCETIDTIHSLITENKRVCDSALQVLADNEDILGKMDDKKEMVRHLVTIKEEIQRMGMDPAFPQACKKETPEKKGIAL